MPTYADFFQPPTEEEMRRRITVINMLREREECAKIADSYTTGAAEEIAKAIRDRPVPLKTLGDIA